MENNSQLKNHFSENNNQLKNLKKNEQFNDNKNTFENKKINKDIEKIIKYYQTFSDDKNNIQMNEENNINNQNLNYNDQKNLVQNGQLNNDNIDNGKSFATNQNNKEEIHKIPLPNNVSLNNRKNIKTTRNIETKSNESKSNTQNDDLTYSNDYILSEDDNTNNSNFFNKNNINPNNSNIQSNNSILNSDNNINNNIYNNDNIINNNDNNIYIKKQNDNNKNIKYENNINDNLNNKNISKKNSETQTIIEKPIYKKTSSINIIINSNTTRNPTNKIFQELKEKNKKIMLDEGTQYYNDIDNFSNKNQDNLIKENFEKLRFQNKLNNSTIRKKQKKISSIDFDNSENLTSYSRKNESQRMSYVNMLKNSSTKKLFSPLIEKELIHYPSTNHFFNSNNNTSNNNSNNFKSNYFKINTDDFYNISPRQKVLEGGNNNIYNIPRHYNNKKTETKYQKTNNDFITHIYNGYNNFNNNNKLTLNNYNINKKTLFSPQKNNIDDFEKIKNKFFKNEKREFNKNSNIMPPNPYETVLNAREFFFFNE